MKKNKNNEQNPKINDFFQTIKLHYSGGSYRAVFPKSLIPSGVDDNPEYVVKVEGNKIILINEFFYTDILVQLIKEIIQNESLENILSIADISLFNLKKINTDKDIKKLIDLMNKIVIQLLSFLEKGNNINNINLESSDSGFNVSYRSDI